MCLADVDFCDESNSAGSEPVTRWAGYPGDVGLWDEPNRAVSELVLWRLVWLFSFSLGSPCMNNYAGRKAIIATPSTTYDDG